MSSRKADPVSRARLHGLVIRAVWDATASGKKVVAIKLSGYWLTALAKDIIYHIDGTREMDTPAGRIPVKKGAPPAAGFRLEYE